MNAEAETAGGSAQRLAEAQAKIAAAARGAHRDPAEVKLIAVSKTFGAPEILPVLQAGHRLYGENRVQEAKGKWPQLKTQFPDLKLHLIGPLQSNKAKEAVELFDAIHSIDRPKIAEAIDREASARGLRVDGFLEVNVGAEESKHGFLPDGLAEAARPLARLARLEGEAAGLRIVGLMAIPPFVDDPEASRRWFVRLRELARELAARPEWAGFPGLLSMGMSHDYEIAIEEGATHVRVGTALFGVRG